MGGDDTAYAFDVSLRLRGWKRYRVVSHRLGGDLLEGSDHFWDKHPRGTTDLWCAPRRAPGDRRRPIVDDDGAGAVRLVTGTEPRERMCLEVVVDPERAERADTPGSCFAFVEACVDGVARPDVVWLGTEPTPALPLRVDLAPPRRGDRP